jgi:hypothetical protein
LTDHHWEKSGSNHAPELFVGVLHERAGPVGHIKAGGAPLDAFPIRRAMRSDHNSSRAGALAVERGLGDALASQPLAHNRVVHQLAQNREWLLGGELFRQGDGVAHTETHSEIFCDQDFHG